jgi:hypothetical protein
MVIQIGNWLEVKDSDPRAVGLYRRHYSCRDPKVDYCRYGFSGKGESMVLLTVDCRALWCWRLVKDEGVYCSVFRNEGDILSSELIKEADALAWGMWDIDRHFTHVNPRQVNSDGKCFKAAGWRKLKGRTKKLRLITLEIFRANNHQWNSEFIKVINGQHFTGAKYR